MSSSLESSPGPARDAAAAISGGVAALAFGAIVAAWAGRLADAFGHAPDAVATLGTVAALGFAVGTFVDPRPGARDASRPLRAVGRRIAALGLFTLAAQLLSGKVAGALVWAGGSLDAAPAGLAFARVVVGGLLLVPAGLLAGSALRNAVRATPPGPIGAAVPGGVLALAVAGAVASRILSATTAIDLVPGPAAAVLLVAAGTALLLRDRARAIAGEEPALPLDAAPGRVPSPAAAGTAFALAAFGYLGARALAPTFGNDLPGIPIASALFLLGILIGAAAGAAVLPASRGRGGSDPTAVALLLAAPAALLGIYARFDELPARFAVTVAEAGSLSEVVRAALRQGAPGTLPLGLLGGAAAALLPGAAPSDPAARPAWLARTTRTAAAGMIAGLFLPRLFLVPLGLGGAVLLAAGISALLGAVALATSGERRSLRVIVAAAALVVGALPVVGLPAPDRAGLLVERGLISGSLPEKAVQKNWTTFDEDGPVATFTVLKRGHARRLLVNGRYEMGSLSEIKSHGMLAHLPLCLHPESRRACLIGAGNGIAERAALAHPLQRLDLLVTGMASVRAAEHFGASAAAALADPRVRIRAGDPVDLLARSSPGYDVILNHASGAWSALSARVSTREFLRLVSDRLAEDGLYCQWVPGNSLTKEGFQILLQTVASVFPQVEVWAGQGADVLVLASKRAGPHDLERVLDAYRDPDVFRSCGASWLADPLTLLSHYLADDGKVRGIVRSSPVHSRRTTHLTSEEAGRRIGSFTIDPVPALAEIRGDVLPAFTNLPAGFAPAMSRALEARDLEREGLDAEIRFTGHRLEPRDALNLYERGLQLNPRDGALRRALATLRSRMGIEYSFEESFAAAYSNMLQAVELDSTFAEGFGNLGSLLADNGDFDYALAVTRKALELAPDDDLLVHQMARIWKQRGYFDRALPYYRKAMEINPKNVEAALGYSDVLLAMDADPDLDGNLAFLESYLALEPDNKELLYRINKLRDIRSRGLDSEQAPEKETPLLMRAEPDSADTLSGE